jgi:hypothetical protein
MRRECFGEVENKNLRLSEFSAKDGDTEFEVIRIQAH